MARQTFFSFRYHNDNWRANIVRNSWVTQDRKASGFFDTADWEKVKRSSDAAIENWIDAQLIGTSVTVVLIGADTAGKKWINYEIVASHRRGNGLLGVHINNVKDRNGLTSLRGKNPFDSFNFTKNGLSVSYPVYDWVGGNGYQNLGTWIEKAAGAAGR